MVYARRRPPALYDPANPPVTPAAPGSTLAKEANVSGGLLSGDTALNTPAARALAAAPSAVNPVVSRPAVLAGTPADAGAMLRQAATFGGFGSVASGSGNAPAAAVVGTGPQQASQRASAAAELAGTFARPSVSGAIGPRVVAPASEQPVSNLVGTTASANGGYATVGVANPGGPAGGGTGIFRNGVEQVKDGSGQFIDKPGALPGKFAATASEVPSSPGADAPGSASSGLSHDEQRAQVLALYPQVGVAGSAQNKAFVDAFNKGGQNFGGVLDLANNLFAPKTQAQAVAQERAATQAVTAKQVAQDQANLTPEQITAQQKRYADNAAKVAAAGKPVYDPSNTAQNVGRTLADLNGSGSLQSFKDYYGDPNGLVGGALQGVKNLFRGFDSDPAAAAAVPAGGAAVVPPSKLGADVAATAPIASAGPITPAVTAAATAPLYNPDKFTAPSPVPLPAATDPNDPNNPLKKKLPALATN